MKHDRITGITWIPFALLLIGIILKWIHVDDAGILLNVGFLFFGLITLIEAINAEYYKQLNLDTFQVVLPIIVVLQAADNLMTDKPDYILLAAIGIVQYTLKQRRSPAVKRRRKGFQATK